MDTDLVQGGKAVYVQNGNIVEILSLKTRGDNVIAKITGLKGPSDTNVKSVLASDGEKVYLTAVPLEDTDVSAEEDIFEGETSQSIDLSEKEVKPEEVITDTDVNVDVKSEEEVSTAEKPVEEPGKNTDSELKQLWVKNGFEATTFDLLGEDKARYILKRYETKKDEVTASTGAGRQATYNINNSKLNKIFKRGELVPIPEFLTSRGVLEDDADIDAVKEAVAKFMDGFDILKRSCNYVGDGGKVKEVLANTMLPVAVGQIFMRLINAHDSLVDIGIMDPVFKSIELVKEPIK